MDEHRPNLHATVIDDERLTESDHVVWSRFVSARSTPEFCQSWLLIQCRRIDRVRAGVVLLQEPGGPTYVPGAIWPESSQDMRHLTATAESALRERRGVVCPAAADAGGTRHEIGYPVEIPGALVGVVVLELDHRADAELQLALRQLHWGVAGLVAHFLERHIRESETVQQRVMNVLDLVATAVEQQGFKAQASALVTEMATRLDCDRVAIGFTKRGQAQLETLSHSAHFKTEANLARAIEAAMDEAIDQEAAVVTPPVDGGVAARILRANEALSRMTQHSAVASVPFHHDGEWLGAITLERQAGHPFELTDIELCQAVMALAGPVLSIARREDRWVGAKVAAGAGDMFARLVGTGHLAWKAVALAVIAIAVVLSFATGEYRVRAEATTEGGTLRAIVAPFDGFIADAPVRAGDVVEAGQLMAVIDDQDLQLERLKWDSQRDQYLKELRQTKAEGDKARIGILSAQLAQAEAQLELVNDQLARTRLAAPYRGVVVAGDLSKNLGAPLDKGEVLFELAPLDDYRIVMQVDDRDITAVATGQQGELILAAVPDASFPIEITAVTPVAASEEGINYFRVEAALKQSSPRLRPGMEGVAKIAIGERKLIWIWTHRFTEWVRLWLWSWWP